MQKLNLPESNISVKDIDGIKNIFDTIRRKWVKYTPEEWVRQNIVHYLIFHKGYPQGLISIEYYFVIDYGKKHRADIVIFNKYQKPLMVIECKSNNVKIGSEALEQVAKYNTFLKAKYIFVSNGYYHYIMNTSNYIDYAYANEIPSYTELNDQNTDNT